jgi:glucan phosphorylase
VVPAFYERDENGVPRAWVARIKASLRTAGPTFTTTRMVGEYVDRMYRPPT